ncbi:MAG: VCBS repeat-containing protein [Bacteroidota bacterium]
MIAGRYITLIVGLVLGLPAVVGQNLFKKLPASQTGIDFNNRLRDKREANILIYSNFYGGAGVGIIDVNQDGLPDIFFAGNQVADRLYLNQGDFVFEDISDKAGILKDKAWSSGVVIADVNQDGWDDIYVTCELYEEDPDLRRNKLYLNQAGNGFTEVAAKWGIDDPGRSRHATFLDHDRDGDLDLFLLNQPPNPGAYFPDKSINLADTSFSPRLYENLGKGFRDISRVAGFTKSGFPNSVSAVDIDQDGWTDLFVSNDFNAPDFLYHNNGDGTFTDIMPQAMRHTSFYSMGVDAADINNDGLTDLMVLDMVAEDNFRLKANMSGMDPAAFWKVVKEGGHYQYMFNAVHLNQGNNVFSEIAQLAGMAATDWSWSNLLADFDNDGWKDAFITNGLLRDIRNTDADKAVTKAITKATTDYIMAHPDDADVSLFDIIDLKEVLALLPSQELPNYAYRNINGLQFENVGKAWGLDTPGFSNGCAYADFDRDGRLDLVVNNINEKAFVYQNQGSGHHYLRIQLTDPKQQTILGSEIEIRSGDQPQHYLFTNVRGMYSSSEQIAHFGLKEENEVESIQISWPDGSVQHLKNIAADQVLVVEKTSTVSESSPTHAPFFEDITSQSGLDFVHKENYFDDYQYQVLLPHELSHFGPALAVADVNGDGRDDVFLGGASGQTGALYLQTQSGILQLAPQQAWQGESLMEDVDAAFVDVDGDADLDLYVASGGNEFPANSPFYQDRLYLNDGQGNFQLAHDALPATNISSSKVLAFDADRDGDQDLLIAARFVPRDYPAPASSLFLRNEGGTFSDQSNVLAPCLKNIGLITDAISTDLDQNGWPDLILTGEWMAPMILMNQAGHFSPNQDITLPKGWWMSINLADMDGDGDQDFVLGNLGLNYKYQASPEAPFEVFYDDFDQNGKKDIVLSYYNFGEKYPVRGRSCSAQQIPAIGAQFGSYEAFAASSLSDIYAPDLLGQSLHLSASSFASAYVENLGQGKFAIRPLPVEAQLSALQDVVLTDANDDGHLDILAAGNLYVSEIETPRADAGIGCLLLGDSKGNFQPVPASKSGLYLDRDVRKVRSMQLNGQQVLVVAANHDHAKVIRFQKP